MENCKLKLHLKVGKNAHLLHVFMGQLLPSIVRRRSVGAVIKYEISLQIALRPEGYVCSLRLLNNNFKSICERHIRDPVSFHMSE